MTGTVTSIYTTVIINPEARSGAARSCWRKLAPELRNAIGPFEARVTQSRGDAIHIAREAIAAGTGRIVAFGGDGTISEVANGILGSENPACQLGILPFGTGNDFCRSLGISSKLNEALGILEAGRIKLVDAGEVEFVGNDSQVQKRIFMNVASCGLSPEVNRLVNSHGHWFGKRWSGRLCYLIATLVAKSRFQPVEVRFTAGREPEQTAHVLAIVIANGKYFGGGIQIAQQADLGDSRLYSVVVRPIGFVRLLANIHRFYGGDLAAMEEIDGFSVEQMNVTSADGSPVQIELDGEVVGRLPATFRVLPNALGVIA